MDLAEVGNGKLRVDIALRTQSRAQRRVIECLCVGVRQPGVRSGGEIVRHRALGNAQRGGDLALGNAHSCLRRRTSRIRRMVIRLAGTAGSLNKRERAYPAESSNYHALQRRHGDHEPAIRAS